MYVITPTSVIWDSRVSLMVSKVVNVCEEKIEDQCKCLVVGY